MNEKRIYISADYDVNSGDLDVVNVLKSWGNDNLHSTDFVDMSEVVSGSISKNPDCRSCDLKDEFNKQINKSSSVIFVVGDHTALRTGGSECSKAKNSFFSDCTPYKHNYNGSSYCNKSYPYYMFDEDNVNPINNFSFLRHEFEQAKKKNKNIIIVFNSLKFEYSWLPNYMNGYEEYAMPFWIKNSYGENVGNYYKIKELI